jgi:hypothetical protein
MTPTMIQSAGGVYVPGKMRTTQTPLYDTYAIALGAAMIPGGLLKMFGNVQGLAGVGPQTTNMQQAFQLSGTQRFLVRAMRVLPIGCGLVDWTAFCLGFTVRLIVGSSAVAYGDAPPEYWPGGGGISLATAVNNGTPDPRAIATFENDPIPLEAGINFRVEVVGTSPGNAAAAFAFRVYLDGERTDGAQ